MNSEDSKRLREEFARQITDEFELQAELLDALTRKKPFQEFKYVIDCSGPFRQDWFDFKNQKMIKWVEDQLVALKL
jgi:hypothetical protein